MKKWVSGLILALTSVYLFLAFRQVPLNSDHANQVLQGQDILNGNYFLSDWNLTGVTFYFSELPFYVLGAAVYGISTEAYLFAASLMIILLYLCSIRIAFCKFEAAKILFFTALAGMPTLTRLGYLRGHCAIFIYYFLSLYCLDRLFDPAEKHKKIRFVEYLLLTALGCMSDMTLCLIGVLLQMVFCAWNLLRNGNRLSRSMNVCLLCGGGLAVIVGALLDALLIRIGNINKNTFMDSRKFLDVFKIPEKLSLLAQGFADTYGGAIFAVVLVLLTLYCAVQALKQFLFTSDFDVLSVLASLSLLMIIAVCFLTDIYANVDCARYIAYLPFLSGVLISRHAEKTMLFCNRQKRVITSAVSLVLMAYFSLPLTWTRPETPQDRLAVFLEEHQLYDGYSAFWNASHTTVASNNRVRLRSIRVRAVTEEKPDYAAMQNWFCKNSWYTAEPHTFVVTDPQAYLSVREDWIIELFGQPKEILACDEYHVLVYDRDLTEAVMLE